MNREQVNEFLSRTAGMLDIPDHIYEDAVIKYEEVGILLSADGSQLQKYSPEIYPQGSFRLGTIVRPYSREGEYDIDLVCHLNLEKTQVSQADLKTKVGDRLQEDEELKKILSESRRCWTLKYKTQQAIPSFHMDILPAINNSDGLPTGILITDTELTLWQKSDPKAYADWFYKQMEVIFLEKRAALAKSVNANIEDVPEWQVKTPLQISIQILKRHRDIYFQDNLENKPVSIIITTLAARAYKGQADIFDALQCIVKNMPSFIEKRNEKWWVANPVAEENFADKWNEYPERKNAFLKWLNIVQIDFLDAEKKKGLSEIAKTLSPILGESVLAKVASQMGESITNYNNLPSWLETPEVPGVGDTKHVVNPIWSEKVQHSARIQASVYKQKDGKLLWQLSRRAVPRNVWLKFRVVTDTPPPYDVRWQVVNTGEDAQNANQLRGGFQIGENTDKNVNWEATAYRGTHWVEAFIIKEGICVAKSGRKYVKIR